MAANRRWQTHQKVDRAVARAARRIPAALRRFIFWRDNDTCRYCGRTPRPLYEFWTNRLRLVIDHVLPVHFGGTSDPENLVLACDNCNARKGWKTLEQAGMRLLPVCEAT